MDRLRYRPSAILGLLVTNLLAVALFPREAGAFELYPSPWFASDTTPHAPASGVVAAVPSHSARLLERISPSAWMVVSGASVLAAVFLAMYRVSYRRQAHELKWRAHHDTLTELPNRWALEKRLEWLVNRRDGARHSGAALLWIDLDDFKSANDALGHQGGDAVLVIVAERLRKCLGDADTLARFGGG